MCMKLTLRSNERIRPQGGRKLILLVVFSFLNVTLPAKADTQNVTMKEEPSITYSSERGIVLRAMQQRPDDPWPRGVGHVILAIPGSREKDKAYLEPGGSFSPAVATFGLSIWLTDEDGKISASSDDIPLDQIRQQFTNVGNAPIPGVFTNNRFYSALWSSCGERCWQLDYGAHEFKGLASWIVVRSVGPAGGPIRSLRWEAHSLKIQGSEGSWTLTPDRPPSAIYLGEEGGPGWKSGQPSETYCESPDGWAYTRLKAPHVENWRLTLVCDNPSPQKELGFRNSSSGVITELPNAQFVDTLNAQVGQLMMGLVRNQTRPGDPVNYPLAWLRDGAYVIVALARCGEVEVAKQLARYFAENDFFGGFGPEADAPGLSIWALEETAVGLQQPEFDRWLWPHVYRKAEFILRMLSTKQPIHELVFGPVVPSHLQDPSLSLVCDPARDGLIVGRMDWERPIMYVNAVSYRGLIAAAELANRAGEYGTAKRWEASARALKEAWNAALLPPESENDRTYTSGLWPTWVASAADMKYEQNLGSHWGKVHDEKGGFIQTPLWTYFNVAEAHQWLYLGKPDRTWITLRWFWANQTSPGLYTWSEGNGEEKYLSPVGASSWVGEAPIRHPPLLDSF